MPASGPRSRRRPGAIVAVAGVGGLLAVLMGSAMLAVLLEVVRQSTECGQGSGGPAGGIELGPPGSGAIVGASEYGGPGDPGTGVVGASGANLLEHPDSYAELGGETFQTATMMGGLPYMTPLRVTWGGHSAIGYKRDFGLGGDPIDGAPRVIDLWWQFAGQLGIPYENGLWSGTVQVERPPATGAASMLNEVPSVGDSGAPSTAAPPEDAGQACPAGGLDGVPLVPGNRAVLMANGQAAAPADAPAAVQEIIAAGNQIVGKPYVYGAAHGLPLSEVAPAYDCSSSVEHLLYGARLLPATYGAPSGDLESFGAPGPGRWVTLYASADHVYMYVAGLRWDTHDAAGSGDGSTGIGWHPLIRSSDGFVARHPEGL